MSDLIDRQAAIATAISGRVRTLPTTEDGENWIRVNEVRDSLLSLPSAQPEITEDAINDAHNEGYDVGYWAGRRDYEPKWIPVTERLPEAGIRYQVTFESGEVGYVDFRNKIFFYDGSAKENVWLIDRYYEDDGEVIAWMPLPEPYRKETEDAEIC